jgi:hypothetical protein
MQTSKHVNLDIKIFGVNKFILSDIQDTQLQIFV